MLSDPSDKLDLRGVSAKTNRARECLTSLANDIAVFCEYERRLRIFETEEEIPTIVGANVPDLPTDYPIRVGEIAYNLRSALDHLVWQLVIDNGGTPNNRIAFPICLDEDQYHSQAKGKLKGVSQAHIEVIRRFQPWQEQYKVGAHLQMLHAICNIDKHRYLNVVALHSSSTACMEEGIDLESTHGIAGGLALWQAVKGTDLEDKVNIEVTADVCFMDRELEEMSVGYGSAIEKVGFKRPPVIPVLTGCLTAVVLVIRELTNGFWVRVDPTTQPSWRGSG